MNCGNKYSLGSIFTNGIKCSGAIQFSALTEVFTVHALNSALHCHNPKILPVTATAAFMEMTVNVY